MANLYEQLTHHLNAEQTDNIPIYDLGLLDSNNLPIFVSFFLEGPNGNDQIVAAIENKWPYLVEDPDNKLQWTRNSANKILRQYGAEIDQYDRIVLLEHLTVNENDSVEVALQKANTLVQAVIALDAITSFLEK
jgi:hypothetical protein